MKTKIPKQNKRKTVTLFINDKPKCYIAGKIGDLPIDEYTKNFNNAKKEVSALGFEPISPVDLPHNHNRSWTAYMKEDLTEMLKCDYVYCLRNWRQSTGANIEIKLALDLGIDIIHQK